MSAKPKAITHGNIYCSLLWFIKSKIEFRINLRVVCKVIDGWWHYIIFHSHNTCNCFHRSCSTQ